jgi:type IV pilus assembly protein PilE
MQKRAHQIGFTLIELMVVVVIVAILAGIAYPSYREYVIQSRRSDAMNAITRTANQLEKFYSYCNTYTTSVAGGWPATCPPAGAGTGLGLNSLSTDQHYEITIAAGALTGACSGVGGANVNCGYTITANPNGVGVTGQQNNNGSLRMDSLGTKEWNRKNSGTWVKWTDK